MLRAMVLLRVVIDLVESELVKRSAVLEGVAVGEVVGDIRVGV